MPTHRGPLRIAHRGMPRQARENTLASFSLALSAGADGIELDVHATGDGAVVVHHDPVTEDGMAIASVTLAELQGREPRPDRQIPTLRDVCAVVQGHAELFVEIKGEGMERAVADVLTGWAGTCAVHAFDHDLIRRLADMKTGMRLGILVEDGALDPAELLVAAGALDAWPHHPIVTQSWVAAVQGMAGRVFPWTVNAPAEIRRLTALDVDGICTDDVSLMT